EWYMMDARAFTLAYGDGDALNITCMSRVEGDDFVAAEYYGRYNSDGAMHTLDVDYDGKAYIDHLLTLELSDDSDLKQANLSGSLHFEAEEILGLAAACQMAEDADADRYNARLNMTYYQDEVFSMTGNGYNMPVNELDAFGGEVAMLFDKGDEVKVKLDVSTEDMDSDLEMQMLLEVQYEQEAVLRLDVGVPDYFPSPPPPALAVTTLTTVIVDVTMTDMDDPEFKATFLDAYIVDTAAAAEVPYGNVEVLELSAGSVRVVSEVTFHTSVSDAEAFAEKATTTEIFSSNFTNTYGSATVEDAETIVLVSPPPPSPPPPPPPHHHPPPHHRPPPPPPPSPSPPPPITEEEEEDDDESKSSGIGLILGIVGGVLGVAMLGGLAFGYRRWMDQKVKDAQNREPEISIHQNPVAREMQLEVMDGTGEFENPIHYHARAPSIV
ncbi:hypothetical protein CYMTET_23886, partial [Cymbomonas tetramitiformis]